MVGQGARLGSVDWTGVDLRGAKLAKCDMRGAKLDGCQVDGSTNFMDTLLNDSSFKVETFAVSGCLQGCKLGAVDWSGLDLTGAKLADINLDGAMLVKTRLVSSDLTAISLQVLAVHCKCVCFSASGLGTAVQGRLEGSSIVIGVTAAL